MKAAYDAHHQRQRVVGIVGVDHIDGNAVPLVKSCMFVHKGDSFAQQPVYCTMFDRKGTRFRRHVRAEGGADGSLCLIYTGIVADDGLSGQSYGLFIGRSTHQKDCQDIRGNGRNDGHDESPPGPHMDAMEQGVL